MECVKKTLEKVIQAFLDSEATRIVQKIGAKEVLAPNEMIILVLKAQTNHFAQVLAH